jgi:hypothetical protein
MGTRQWITAASKQLNLEPHLRLVEPHRFRAILERIVAERTSLSRDGVSALWWWEALKQPVFYSTPAEPISFIRGLLPSHDPVWFVAEEAAADKKVGNFWLYEGTVSAVCAVLQECPAFEYYIVAKNLSWLICENHHCQVIASGEPLAAALSEA